jgi:Cytochrome c554 and c-prime
VDSGDFFPDQAVKLDVSWFLMDAMKLVGTDAIGVGDRELKFGLAHLKAQIKRSGLDVVSANLLDKKTKKPVLNPWVVKKIGTVKVGITSLISTQVDLGPSRDTLTVSEPAVALQSAMAAMKKKGATVTVVLAQLGKTESEDLATAVDGIDVIMVGRHAPLLQKGRMIKNTLAVYGGERGQYVGRSIVSLDAQRHMTTGENEMFVLGPEVGEKKEVLALVKSFEDNLNEKLRKAEKEKAAERAAQQANNSPDRFLGADVCMRCHTDQADQWKTTPHAHAWQTLVDAKKDATPDCIPCHVVGFQKTGGFVSGVETPKLGNVQCENCHGMGTMHDAFATQPVKITEATCTTCHQGDNDPHWNWNEKLPKVIH